MSDMEEEGGDEVGFYMSYGDMVTLLLVLFIYLFSISTLDEGKYIEAAQSLRNEMTTGDPSTGVYEQLQAEKKALVDLESEIQEYIDQHDLEKDLKLTTQEKSVRIDVGNSLLFGSGQANLRENAKHFLKSITNTIKGNGTMVSVEGHTDNDPISTDKFPSNWELSAARAAAVVRYMNSEGIEGNRLVATGKGEFDPVESNATDAGKYHNRRIVIVFKPGSVFKALDDDDSFSELNNLINQEDRFDTRVYQNE